MNGSPSSSRIPTRVLLIGLLLSATGLWNLSEMISSFWQEEISVELGMLTLPVGIGLLQGREWARYWARICFIIGYIVCAAIVLVVAIFRDKAPEIWMKKQLGQEDVMLQDIGLSLVLAALIYILHHLLFTERANAWFFKKALERRRR